MNIFISGGQAGLNLAMEIAEMDFLEEHNEVNRYNSADN